MRLPSLPSWSLAHTERPTSTTARSTAITRLPVALSKVYGTGTSSVDLSDLASTELAVVVGGESASNHPRLITSLVRLRKRGGR